MNQNIVQKSLGIGSGEIHKLVKLDYQSSQAILKTFHSSGSVSKIFVKALIIPIHIC